MGSINISIKDEAYQFLKSLKSENESFSDIILEFKEKGFEKKGSKEGVLKFFGVLKDKDIDWKAKERRMREFREDFNKRIEKTRRGMQN